MKKKTKYWAVGVVVLLLAGCGQKGPLKPADSDDNSKAAQQLNILD